MTDTERHRQSSFNESPQRLREIFAKLQKALPKKQKTLRQEVSDAVTCLSCLEAASQFHENAGTILAPICRVCVSGIVRLSLLGLEALSLLLSSRLLVPVSKGLLGDCQSHLSLKRSDIEPWFEMDGRWTRRTSSYWNMLWTGTDQTGAPAGRNILSHLDCSHLLPPDAADDQTSFSPLDACMAAAIAALITVEDHQTQTTAMNTILTAATADQLHGRYLVTTIKFLIHLYASSKDLGTQRVAVNVVEQIVQRCAAAFVSGHFPDEFPAGREGTPAVRVSGGESEVTPSLEVAIFSTSLRSASSIASNVQESPAGGDETARGKHGGTAPLYSSRQTLLPAPEEATAGPEELRSWIKNYSLTLLAGVSSEAMQTLKQMSAGPAGDDCPGSPDRRGRQLSARHNRPATPSSPATLNSTPALGTTAPPSEGPSTTPAAPANGKYGACIVCSQPANYYCKQTKVPLCSVDCKSSLPQVDTALGGEGSWEEAKMGVSIEERIPSPLNMEITEKERMKLADETAETPSVDETMETRDLAILLFALSRLPQTTPTPASADRSEAKALRLSLELLCLLLQTWGHVFK